MEYFYWALTHTGSCIDRATILEPSEFKEWIEKNTVPRVVSVFGKNRQWPVDQITGRFSYIIERSPIDPDANEESTGYTSSDMRVNYWIMQFSLIFFTSSRRSHCSLLNHFASYSKPEKRKREKVEDRLQNNKLLDYVEDFYCTSCHWLRHWALSPGVYKHWLGRSRGPQPGCLIDPTLANLLVRLSSPFYHLIDRPPWYTFQPPPVSEPSVHWRKHPIGVCRTSTLFTPFRFSFWFNDWTLASAVMPLISELIHGAQITLNTSMLLCMDIYSIIYIYI